MKCRITIPGKITLLGVAFHKHMETGLPLKYWYQTYKKFLMEDSAKQPLKLGTGVICKLSISGNNFDIYIKRKFNKNEQSDYQEEKI